MQFIKILISSFFLILCISFSQASKYLISSSKYTSIPQNSLCKNGFIKKLIEFEKDKAIFASQSSTCGVLIISTENDSFKVLLSIYISDTILDIAVDQTRKLLFIATSSNLLLYQIYSIRLDIQYLKSIPKSQAESPTQKILVTEDKNYLIQINTIDSIVFSITDDNNLIKLQTIQTSSVIKSHIYLPLQKTFIIGNDFAVLYKIESNNINISSLSIDTNSACVSNQLVQPSEFQFIGNQFLLFISDNSGIATVDLQSYFLTRTCSNFQINDLTGSNNSMKFLLLTTDNNYLISRSQFKSIQIFEISTQLNQGGVKSIILSLLQEVKEIDYSYDMVVSLNQENVIISDKESLKSFKSISFDIKKSSPSIVNTPQNVVFNKFDDIEQQSQRCLFHEDFIYQSKGKDGLYILQKNSYNNYINKIAKWKQPTDTYLKSVIVFKNSQLAIVGASILYLLDISTKNSINIAVLKTSNLGDNKFEANDFCISKDELIIFIAGGYNGLYIANAIDLTPISQIYGLNILSAYSENIEIDSKNKFVYVVYHLQGIAVYDVTTLNTPKLASFFYSDSASDIDLTMDDKYLILADKQNGIAVIDISNQYSLKVISRVALKKEVNRIKLIQDDMYIIATNIHSSGQLTLIDLQNKDNPIVKQSYFNKRVEGAFDFCFNSDASIGFITAYNDLIVLNLQSQLKYNLDLYLIKQGEEFIGKYYPPDQVVQVGMQIHMKLTQLYPQLYTQITQVTHYKDLQENKLPEWAVFNQIEQHLSLDIKREALISKDDDIQTIQSNTIIKREITFIYQINEIIQATDFIQNNIPIDTTLSDQIYADCIVQKFINQNQFVSEYSEELISYSFQSKYSLPILQHIVSVIKSKVSHIPFSIQIQSSLLVNLDSKSDSIIQTISNFVRVQLRIPNQDAKFKSANYSGILTTFHQNFYSIILEGNVTFMNQVLKGGINVVNYNNPSLVQIEIVINDNLNYPLQKIIYASHPFLINVNLPIKINPDLSLQDDFNNKFLDSEIFILESFSYQLSPNVFIDEDDQNILFQAQILIDGEYTDLPEKFWLNFSPKERLFNGMPSRSQLGQEYTIQLTGTDGFTQCQTQFTIKVSRIPIIYFIQWFIITLFVIFIVCLFFKKRSSIYNMISSSKYTITPTRIKSGDQFNLQITLIEDNLQQAKQIWLGFLKSISADKIIKEIGIIQKKHEIFSSINRTRNRAKSHKKSQYYVNNEQNNQNLIQNTIQNDQEDVLTESSQFNELKLSPLKQAKLIKKTQNSIINQTQYVKKLVQKKKSVHDKPYYNLLFFNEDTFEINEDSPLLEIEEFYKQTKNPIQKNIKELDNQHSRLSKSVLGCMVSDIANQEKSSLSIIHFLKTISFHQGYTIHDWYKPYVEINSQINEILENPFPQIVVLKKIVEQKVTTLNQNLNPNQQPTAITLNIVYSYIYYSSLGLITTNQSSFNKIRGECLELFPYEISCVKCYRRVLMKSFLTCSLRKVYLEKELSYNYRLPSWIQTLDLTHGVIFIKGNPQNKDCGNYLFKIFDKSNYVVKQFEIQIKQSNAMVNSDQILEIFENYREKITPQVLEQDNGVPDEFKDSGVILYPNSPIHTKNDKQILSLNLENKYF